jgi:hypothetical protein
MMPNEITSPNAQRSMADLDQYSVDLLAVTDEVNNLDHRASTIKIVRATGADAETYEKRIYRKAIENA